MNTSFRQVPLETLVPHPDNANRMSRAKLGKLRRHIEQTGRYEPLVVRPCPNRPGCYQVINGHCRYEALRRLGHETVDVVVWDVDDEQTDVLLATLNRLSGRDALDKKLAVLRRLSAHTPTRTLAKLLPQTQGQLDRLIHVGPLPVATRRDAEPFAVPLVFFVDEAQQQAIEQALSQASCDGNVKARAARRATALTELARRALRAVVEETTQP